MININMTVEIDILADDVSKYSKKFLLAQEGMSKIEDAMKELFDAPLSVDAELLDIDIYSSQEGGNRD